MTESKITHHLKANDYWLGAPEAKPARPRQRKVTLASELRKASKAGVGVRRAEIEPDGKITLTFGEPEPSEETNPWLADLEGKAKQ